MALNLLFVADPLDRFNVERDTTFAMMLEAQRRGHACFEGHHTGLQVERSRAFSRCNRATVQRAAQGSHYARGPWETLPLDHFDAVFMRTDPPMDDRYITALWILDLADRAKTQLINEPRGILAANEKMYALQFPEFTPETLVTSSAAEVKRFFKDVGEDIILKPLDGHGGSGVLRVTAGDRNFNSMIELLTHEGRRWVMVQRYIKAARQGDKRILLVDGNPVGAILRVPSDEDNRGNIHVGAVVQKASITAREQELCAALSPVLTRDGLRFVGIDVIGELLTEVNVTSPTGAQEIARFDGSCPEGVLLDSVEARAVRA